MKARMAVFAVAVLSIALTVLSNFAVGQAAPQAQPHMQDALAHLQEAQKSLEAATHDKGGHRSKALQRVKEAIAEVKQGIEFDDTHKTGNEKKKK